MKPTPEEKGGNVENALMLALTCFKGLFFLACMRNEIELRFILLDPAAALKSHRSRLTIIKRRCPLLSVASFCFIGFANMF